MAGLVSEIAARLRDRARVAEASAGRNEAYARQEREFSALLTEAAGRYAKGEGIEAAAILAAAFPEPFPFNLGGRGIDDDIMSPQQNCERTEMTDADVIRAVCPRHTMKWLARTTGAPIDTARHWLYRHFNPAQRRPVAGALLAEMDRQDIERTALRRRLAAWAAED